MKDEGHYKYIFISRVVASLSALLFLMPYLSAAQQILHQGDIYEKYYRLLQISGEVDDRVSFTLRPVVADTFLHIVTPGIISIHPIYCLQPRINHDYH